MTEKSTRQLREEGFAVVIFDPEELNGASPKHVEAALVEYGWDAISALRGLNYENEAPLCVTHPGRT